MVPLKKDKVFYGWVIVIALLVIGSTLLGIRFSFGVFFKSILDDFGLSRAATSSVYSTYTILGAFCAIVTGWALDKYGPRRVVFIMGLAGIVGLVLTGYTDSLWQLYLTYSLLMAVATTGTMPIVMALVSRWFFRKRGLAMGIAGSGSGLGTLIAAPFAAYLISSVGWRMSFVVIGVIVGVLVMSLSMLLRRNPQEMGTFPDGIKPPAVSGSTAGIDKKVSKPGGFSLKHAFKTRNFWLVFFIFALFAVCLSLITTHLVPYATDVGISAIEASTILSVMSGLQVLSRVIGGRICDLKGKKIPGLVCAGLGIASLVWLTQIRELWMFYLFAVIFGVSWGGLGVVSIMLAGDSFAGPSLGLIMGALEVGFAVGSGAGSFMGGLVFDLTGNYASAFLTGAGAMLMIAVFILLARHGRVVAN